jgi:flagellar protein FlaG
MSNLSTVVPVTDASLGSLPATNKEPVRESSVTENDQPDVRLIIEQDEASGGYVYKTMDRRTGEVIQQFPREEILRLQQDNNYTAGVVVNARA